MSEPKTRKAKALTPAQLADELNRTHKRALASLGEALRVTPTSITWTRAMGRYERRCDEFDALIALVRALEPGAPE